MKRVIRVRLCCILWLAGCTSPTLRTDLNVAQDTSQVEVWPCAVVADGQSQALVVLHVRDGAGAPVPNVRATLAVEAAPGKVWLVQPGPTDSHGKTTGILLTDTPGALSVLTHLPARPGFAAMTLRTQVLGVSPG